MTRFTVARGLTATAMTVGGALAVAQTDQAQQRPTSPQITYEPVAPGVLAALLFRTDALRDVTVELRDLIIGPGKSAPALSVQGFAVTELKSGEVETTIDGQAVKRRPGDFWVVRPGQTYSVANIAGMAVLNVATFSRP